jgi:integrase
VPDLTRGHPARLRGTITGDLDPLVALFSPTKTVRTNYGVLRAILNAAVEADMIARTPCRRIRLPALSKVPKRLATIEEVVSLAEAMPEEYESTIYLGALGLRQAEVFGLRVGAANLHDCLLSIHATVNEVEGQLVKGDGKTASSVREIHLPKYIADRLAEHIERTGRTSPDEFLFQAPGGGPVRATNYRYRVYQPAVRKAGLDGLTFHRLRHSAGDHLREEGVDLEVIKNRLGHSSIRVTADVYGSLPTQVDKAAAAALDKKYRGLLADKRR